MDVERQRTEVDVNYQAFQRFLPELIARHRDEFALMRDAAIVGIFGKPGEAYAQGRLRFPDGIFSIQEVTDEPIDLGFFSHVAF